MKNICNLSAIIKWYETGKPRPVEDYFCETRDVFQARLEKFYRIKIKAGWDVNRTALVVAALGELGNNAFDHNLGKWQDSPGIVFAESDLGILIIDRGQGIQSSLSLSGIRLPSSQDYIDKAFNDIVSGRAPEKRGNGLKLVKSIVQKLNLKLWVKTGTAQYSLFYSESQEIEKLISVVNDGVFCVLLVSAQPEV